LEPELVAAAAAFVRFPHPAVSQHEACLPSPMVGVPVAESAKRFSSWVTAEPVVPFSHPPPSAPFVEAAKHFSSPVSAEPEVPFSSSPASNSFAEAEEHFSSPEAAEPASAFSATAASASFVEAEEHFSSPEGYEPAIAFSPQVVSGPEDSGSLQAIPEEHLVPEAAAPVPVREAVYTHEMKPMEPAASPDSDVPWWLSEASRQPEPSRPPLLWQPAKVWMSDQLDAATEPWPVGPNVSLGPLQVREATTPVSERERIPTRCDSPAADAAAQETQKPEPEEAPANLTSRLSGLRNLLFVMGLKDVHGADQLSEGHAGSQFDPRGERETFERTIPQDREDAASSSVGGAAPRLVTAPPVFLPPKPIVINVDREGPPAGESSTRQDRRAAFDGVNILPSRRGQYKKI
jgi:hypothetical protein